MSLDNSLKSKISLAGKRSVLTKSERYAQLLREKQFDPKKDSVLGMRKVRVKD